MWISKAHYTTLNNLIESAQTRNTEMLRRDGERLRLAEENAYLKAQCNWFMHRLTQVEHERGMLMQDRIGVKISVPAFIPATDDPSEALSRVVDISTIGGDAKDDGSDTDADPTQNPGIDYTNLPGYKRR
jgi:hypothetical protein